MELRLVPINAVVALLTGGGGWPSLLGQQGLDFAWLEAPVKTSKSLVVVDVVALGDRVGLALIVEAKSGAWVEPPQAQKYDAMTLAELRRVVTFRADPKVATIEVLYACLSANEATIRQGLLAAGVAPSLLVIDLDAHRVRLDPATGSRLMSFDTEVPAGQPPGLIRLDADTPDDVYEQLLVAEVVAAMSRDERTIPVSTLLARVPYLGNYSAQARTDLTRRATRVLSAAAKRFPDDFEVRPAAGDVHGAGGTVVIRRSPKDSDHRGETQGWQRLKRRAEGRGRRSGKRENPDQLSLDDLAEQGEMGDT